MKCFYKNWNFYWSIRFIYNNNNKTYLMINKYSKSLDNNFYKKNIKIFYKLLNNVIFGKFFRICLGIKLPMSNKIGLLHTNGYSVDLGNGNLRAELWNYDITSIRLYKMFG